MTQAWTTQGKRMAVTRCQAQSNFVVGSHQAMVTNTQSPARESKPVTVLEIGYGQKKLKNMSKPLRSRLEKSGFSVGVTAITGVHMAEGQESDHAVGDTIVPTTMLEVGDVVTVQGLIKGRGYAGVVKHYGFKGGPKTHGQSDRQRAPGSIGSGTTPGRVYVGKRMAGRYGNETKTISGLVVLHVDQTSGEIWLSGPVPGSVFSSLKISKVGTKKAVELNLSASGIKVEAPQEEAAAQAPVEN